MKTILPSICFVAPSIWPVLSGDVAISHVGGAEVQQSILAQEFARIGYLVTVICLDFGQGQRVNIGDIEVLRAYKIGGGLPIIRFIHPRSTSIWQAMRSANADIYYQRSAGYLTGLVALFCKKYNRKMIYAGAHNTDFKPGKELIKFSRDRAIYRWGLKQANVVIAQNREQASDCKALSGKIENVTIGNCHPIPIEQQQNNKKEIDVLWVSTIREWKRPELLFQIAEKLPDVSFTMIGGPSGDQHYYEKIKATVEQYSNVNFLGFVPYEKIGIYFDRAKILINTSNAEGFPNTFLQAWSRKIPTISFFYLDMEQKTPGKWVRDTTEAIDTIKDWLITVNNLTAEGNHCFQTFLQYNSTEAVIGSYMSLFTRLQENAL